MVCSNCHNWIDGEWLVWRRCDTWEHQWVPSCTLSFHVWQGRMYFFYCQRCRAIYPSLKGKCINVNGSESIDSDSEKDEVDRSALQRDHWDRGGHPGPLGIPDGMRYLDHMYRRRQQPDFSPELQAKIKELQRLPGRVIETHNRAVPQETQVALLTEVQLQYE